MNATAATRDQLVLDNYAMVHAIARRIHRRLPRHVDLDDLIGAGTAGLLDAVERYDATQSVPFKTYARYRIRGAVVDSLRTQDWVPRSVRRKSDRIQDARERLLTDLGRAPNREELAGALEMGADEFDAYERDARLRTLVSLDTPTGEDENTPLVEQLAGEADVAEGSSDRQIRELVLAAVDELPEREKTAIALYYFHELTLKEVGQVLGVTESRACQLSGQGIKRLRKRLRPHLG